MTENSGARPDADSVRSTVKGLMPNLLADLESRSLSRR